MKLKPLAAIIAMLITVAFIAPVFSQEMPAPGTTITKSNFKKYAHLFPEEFTTAFEDGFGGVISPIKVNVVESKTKVGQPKAFLEYSARNKGKFGIDAQGNITGGWAYDGLPFPDLKPGDKDFATKFMWNYQGRYMWDDLLGSNKGGSIEKRKGEKIRWNTAVNTWPFFKNRMACQNKPNMENPIGLYKANVFHYVLPDSVKNTISLSYRFADLNKPDETYLYLPSMRRVLRAEAGQRSTPMLGSTNALDDFNAGFDGHTGEFTYTLIKEQKVLAAMEGRLNHVQVAAQVKEGKSSDLPYEYDGYEMRDVYVIDVKPKDSKYPQSRKRLYLDKSTMWPLYAIAWDRAGKVWKIWTASFKTKPVGNDTVSTMYSQFGVDLQFGMATYFATDFTHNSCKFTYNDVTPASLLRRAR